MEGWRGTMVPVDLTALADWESDMRSCSSQVCCKPVPSRNFHLAPSENRTHAHASLLPNAVDALSPEMPSLSGRTMLRGAPSEDSTRCMPGFSGACLSTSSWISEMGASDCLTTQRYAPFDPTIDKHRGEDGRCRTPQENQVPPVPRIECVSASFQCCSSAQLCFIHGSYTIIYRTMHHHVLSYIAGLASRFRPVVSASSSRVRQTGVPPEVQAGNTLCAEIASSTAPIVAATRDRDRAIQSAPGKGSSKSTG